jgi:hypothetical protein
MRLYLFNMELELAVDKVEWQLTLEGDATDADDGDWSATGGGAGFLKAMSGYWFVGDLNNWVETTPKFGLNQTIWLRSGRTPTVRFWRMPDTVAWLDTFAPGIGIPVTYLFPLHASAQGDGAAFKDDLPGTNPLTWRLLHRFF